MEDVSRKSVSQGAISILANATTQQISNNIGGGNDHIAAIAMANFGIPLQKQSEIRGTREFNTNLYH